MAAIPIPAVQVSPAGTCKLSPGLSSDYDRYGVVLRLRARSPPEQQ